MAKRGMGFALTLAALAALCAGSDSALAKQKGRKGGRKTEKAQLERPSETADANARGTVEITEKKRGKHAVIKLRNLDPKTVYDVVDSGTGDLLGTVRTNRKGRANFEMGVGAANKPVRSDSTHGEDAGDDKPNDGGVFGGGMGGDDGTTGDDGSDRPDDDGMDKPYANGDCGDPGDIPVDDLEGVEVWCADTEECVLSCDFRPIFEDFEYSYGWAEYGSEDTGTGYASLSHYESESWNDDSFSFTYVPPSDPSDDLWGWYKPHSTWVSTSAGQKLPLDVDSAEKLGGLDFQVTSADGATVLLEGVLPKVETFKWDDQPIVIDDPDWNWDEGDWTDWEDYEDGWKDDDPTMPPGTNSAGNYRSDGSNGQSDGSDPDMKDPPDGGDWNWEQWPEPEIESTVLLFIRSPDSGEFVKVADLNSYKWDVWIDIDPIWEGEWDWEDDGSMDGTRPDGTYDPANSAGGKDYKRAAPGRQRGGRSRTRGSTTTRSR